MNPMYMFQSKKMISRISTTKHILRYNKKIIQIEFFRKFDNLNPSFYSQPNRYAIFDQLFQKNNTCTFNLKIHCNFDKFNSVDLYHLKQNFSVYACM